MKARGIALGETCVPQLRILFFPLHSSDLSISFASDRVCRTVTPATMKYFPSAGERRAKFIRKAFFEREAETKAARNASK